MVHYLEILAMAVGLTTALGASVRWVWLLSVNLRETRQMVRQNKVTLGTLQGEIIDRLDAMRAEVRANADRFDARLDKLDKDVSFLFGRTKTTIPPKD